MFFFPEHTFRFARGRRLRLARALAVKSQKPLSSDSPTRVGRGVKRALDMIFAAAALVFLSPLLVTVAIAIKLDSRGPAIFRQRRTGCNGTQFVILKFRTMTVLDRYTGMSRRSSRDPCREMASSLKH